MGVNAGSMMILEPHLSCSGPKFTDVKLTSNEMVVFDLTGCHGSPRWATSIRHVDSNWATSMGDVEDNSRTTESW